jgi:intracellular sulfur oxidation DsrE/DsrF family protein
MSPQRALPKQHRHKYHEQEVVKKAPSKQGGLYSIPMPKEENPMPRLLMLTLLACLTLSPATLADAEGPGVVFHLDSETSMNRMLAQVARHHSFNPDIETRVILIGNGVKPALEGAEDANGGRYSAQMEQLMASGIRIFACEATLNYYNLTEDDLAFGVETVPSGVAALGRLQAREGWGYLKL